MPTPICLCLLDLLNIWKASENVQINFLFILFLWGWRKIKHLAVKFQSILFWRMSHHIYFCKKCTKCILVEIFISHLACCYFRGASWNLSHFSILAQSFYWFQRIIYILFLPLIFIEVYLINKNYVYGCTKWCFNICIDCEKWKWKLLSRVWLFVTPWTIQYMEFSRPEYWSG